MNFETLKDKLINLGLLYNKETYYDYTQVNSEVIHHNFSFDNISSTYLNIVIGETYQFLFFYPFFALDGYIPGCDWYNKDIFFRGSCLYKMGGHGNPLCIDFDYLKKFEIFKFNDDRCYTDSVNLNNLNEQLEEVYEFTIYIKPKIDNFMQQIKTAKFRAKLSKKTEQPKEHNRDIIDTFIDNEEAIFEYF